MKLCLACSAGGHLTELEQIKMVYDKRERFFITFKREDSLNLSEKEKTYFVRDPSRNPVNFLINLFQSMLIILREGPDVVITTGAGVAIAPCYFAKILGKKVIYIESFCRTDKPSLSGRIIYRIADLFLVQWKPLLKEYGSKAVYSGTVF